MEQRNNVLQILAQDFPSLEKTAIKNAVDSAYTQLAIVQKITSSSHILPDMDMDSSLDEIKSRFEENNIKVSKEDLIVLLSEPVVEALSPSHEEKIRKYIANNHYTKYFAGPIYNFGLTEKEIHSVGDFKYHIVKSQRFSLLKNKDILRILLDRESLSRLTSQIHFFVSEAMLVSTTTNYKSVFVLERVGERLYLSLCSRDRVAKAFWSGINSKIIVGVK